jgi:exopolysaccharide biosynthesis protein
VEVAELRASEPRRLSGVALRIDLQAEGISFLATPANGEKEGETDAQLTSAFLKEHGLQAAINGAPFDIVHDQPGKPQDVHGLLVSEGKKVSKAAGAPALIIDRANRAWIEDPMTKVPESAWNAVGGFAVVLRNGEPTGKGDANLHPRTAAGVSKDGRWLFWVVMDGRQFGHSGGVSTAELAGLCKHLGAWDAINLDGGGTSTLVVAGPDGVPQILNRPVHRGIPGQERLSACHLGLRARVLGAGG